MSAFTFIFHMGYLRLKQATYPSHKADLKSKLRFPLLPLYCAVSHFTSLNLNLPSYKMDICVSPTDTTVRTPLNSESENIW